MHAVHSVTVDRNGLVLFEPTLLRTWFGSQIPESTNLLQRFTTSDDGEAVTALGAAVPVLGLNDSTYDVHVRQSGEPSLVDPLVIFENGIFPIQVVERLVLADAAVLHEWQDDAGWQWLELEPGFYALTIRGFQTADMRCCGFEFVFAPTPALPELTGSFTADMQVNQPRSRVK